MSPSASPPLRLSALRSALRLSADGLSRDPTQLWNYLKARRAWHETFERASRQEGDPEPPFELVNGYLAAGGEALLAQLNTPGPFLYALDPSSGLLGRWSKAAGLEVGVLPGGIEPAKESLPPETTCLAVRADTAREWWLAFAAGERLSILSLARGSIDNTKNGRGSIRTITFAPNGRSLVTTDDHGGIALWDIAEGRLRLANRSALETTTAPALFDASGLTAVLGHQDGKVTLNDVAAGFKQMGGFQLHEAAVTHVAVSLAGRKGASAAEISGAGEIAVWSLNDPKDVRRWAVESKVTSLAMAGDGRLVLATDDQRTLHLWEAETGRRMAQFTADAPVQTWGWANRYAVVGDTCGNVLVFRLMGPAAA